MSTELIQKALNLFRDRWRKATVKLHGRYMMYKGAVLNPQWKYGKIKALMKEIVKKEGW